MVKRAVTIELLGLLPEVYKLCTKCQPLDYLKLAKVNYVEDELLAYPEAILIEQKRLWNLYNRLTKDFSGCARLVPVGLMSFRGMWLSLRHGLKNAPSLVIGGKRIVLAKLPYDEIKRIIPEELEKTSGLPGGESYGQCHRS